MRSLVVRGVLTTVAILLWSFTVAAAGSKVTLTGTVLDAEGTPVAGATVGAYWRVADGKLTSSRSVTTDKEGRYEFETIVWPGRTYSLMAVDKDQKLGAFAIYTGSQDGPLDFELADLVDVKGAITCKALDEIPGFASVNVWLKDKRIRVLGNLANEGNISLRLPVGEYRISLYLGKDYKSRSILLTIGTGVQKVTLKTVDVEPSVLSTCYGKEPPAWQCSDARNLPVELKEKGGKVQPSDFKGKWLLVEFWGYW